MKFYLVNWLLPEQPSLWQFSSTRFSPKEMLELH
jgi:hypothetical protein